MLTIFIAALLGGHIPGGGKDWTNFLAGGIVGLVLAILLGTVMPMYSQTWDLPVESTQIYWSDGELTCDYYNISQDGALQTTGTCGGPLIGNEFTRVQIIGGDYAKVTRTQYHMYSWLWGIHMPCNHDVAYVPRKYIPKP